MIPGLVVAGTQSGCGKTTVALGLMATLTAKGLKIQGYKTGPDYIDPSFYPAVTGRPGENLDSWMTGAAGVRRSFVAGASGADLMVVEGAMGLFDGANAVDETGSTAEIAKLLGLPVLLVIDARSMARSAAALIKGFTEFDPELRFAGIIFNRVGSEKHLRLLSEATVSATNIPVLGGLPRNATISLPERHLGLAPFYERPELRQQLDSLAEWFSDHADLDRLRAAFQVSSINEPEAVTSSGSRKVRIGIARDAAFGFYYQDNLRLLEQAGAELAPFSPLNDKKLPLDLDGLYLGGGYPELFAAELAANINFIDSLKDAVTAGMAVYAECGGLIYLGKTIRTAAGIFPMSGILEIDVEMEERQVALGYVEVAAAVDNLLLAKGETARGHEFHYSRIARCGETANAFLTDKGEVTGFQKGNLLASYAHLHFGSNLGMAKRWVEQMVEKSDLSLALPGPGRVTDAFEAKMNLENSGLGYSPP
jgi:cobyrinic acid a,c-diamide synthase